MNYTDKSQSRIVWVDIFKAICIISMVLGHAGAPFITYIYLFHMPAFIFISGYTYRGEKYPLHKYIFHKAKNLLIPMLLINCIYIALYVLLQELGVYHYFQDGDPISLLERLKMLFFRFGTPDLGGATCTTYSVYALPSVFIFTLVTVYSFILIFKRKDFSLFMAILSIGCSLAAVLPIINTQHRLYLYIPSVFVGFTFGLFLKKICMITKHNYCWECVILLIPCIYLVKYTPGMIKYRQNWLSICQSDTYSVKQILKLGKPVSESNIYIKGASDGYNVLYYGPGNSLRLLFDDKTLKPVLVDEFPEQPEKPYLFLEYKNGDIISGRRKRFIS